MGGRTWTLHGGKDQRGLEASSPTERDLATESTLEGLSGGPGISPVVSWPATGGGVAAGQKGAHR